MSTKRSRRQFLAFTAAGITGTVAGCLSDEDDLTPTGETVDELPTPVQGNPDADVTVAVYEDFSCPGCQSYKLTVYPDIKAEFVETDRIRYEHHDRRVLDDEWSYRIPSAARAVQDTEGDDAFFAFAEAIYPHQGEYSFDTVEEVATEVGADGDVVRAAAEDLTYLPVIEASSEAGQDRGVSSTPTVAVNDELLVPQQGEDFYQQVASAIESAE